MLEEMGYKAHTYQENKRTRYMLDGVEFDIDSWPYIPTYLEIEGKNEKDYCFVCSSRYNVCAGRNGATETTDDRGAARSIKGSS